MKNREDRRSGKDLLIIFSGYSYLVYLLLHLVINNNEYIVICVAVEGSQRWPALVFVKCTSWNESCERKFRFFNQKNTKNKQVGSCLGAVNI